MLYINLESFVLDPTEYIFITKEPDKSYYEPTTSFIQLSCIAEDCNVQSYSWYKDTDLNTTIGNDSLYTISDVEMENSGNYICIVKIIINKIEHNYNQTVTIDIRTIGE